MFSIQTLRNGCFAFPVHPSPTTGPFPSFWLPIFLSLCHFCLGPTQQLLLSLCTCLNLAQESPPRPSTTPSSVSGFPKEKKPENVVSRQRHRRGESKSVSARLTQCSPHSPDPRGASTTLGHRWGRHAGMQLAEAGLGKEPRLPAPHPSGSFHWNCWSFSDVTLGGLCLKMERLMVESPVPQC